MKKIFIALMILGLTGTWSFAAENTVTNQAKQTPKVEKQLKEQKPEVKQHTNAKNKKHTKMKKDEKVAEATKVPKAGEKKAEVKK